VAHRPPRWGVIAGREAAGSSRMLRIPSTYSIRPVPRSSTRSSAGQRRRLRVLIRSQDTKRTAADEGAVRFG
jgi:hypothetical protein